MKYKNEWVWDLRNILELEKYQNMISNLPITVNAIFWAVRKSLSQDWCLKKSQNKEIIFSGIFFFIFQVLRNTIHII